MLSVLIFVGTSRGEGGFSITQLSDKALVVSDRVVVKFLESVTPQKIGDQWSVGIASVDALLNDVKTVERAIPQARGDSPFGLNRVYVLTLKPGLDLANAVEKFGSDPSLEYAEPRYVRSVDRIFSRSFMKSAQVDTIPNDPYYPNQWGLPQIQAPDAWEISQGDTAVVIAVVDLGMDLDHPDLEGNIWINWVELNGTAGVDDDSNGWVDDFHGWDFTDEDNDPNPNSSSESHGSHCAGIASAVTDNGIGVAGLGWHCRLMAVRTGIWSSQQNTWLIIHGFEGIYYAARSGANIISLSWGGTGGSNLENDVIQDARARGCLVIAAAGNDGRDDLHYPSAYEGVMAVASTSQQDHRSGFSNFGTWVDVSAPGSYIYSTVVGGYGYKSGTSMACPLVAGLGGLVFAHNPYWNADQVAMQIMATADDIDALNPGYEGLLGSGRINAYRALTDSVPGIACTGNSFDDTAGGDGDGIIDPGETIELVVTIMNFLEPAFGVTATLSTQDDLITITQAAADFGDLGTGEDSTNSQNPYVFVVSDEAPGGHNIIFRLDIEADGGAYTNQEYFNLMILPVYGDHNIGNVVFTITNFGAYGYEDYVEGTSLGNGFQYPAGSTSALFHGSFWAGTGPNQVSDCSYGNAAQNAYDWEPLQGGELSIGGMAISDQDGFGIFQDTGAENPMGLKVTQNSYAWADPPDDDYVMLEFVVENVSGDQVNNIYFGLYMDWDINVYDDNSANYDSMNSLGYMYGPMSNFYGIALLSNSPTSYRAVRNEFYVWPGFSDANKYLFMTEGFVVTQSTTPHDWSHVLSTGPYILAPREGVTVAYAVLGGDDLADLQANAQAAQARYDSLTLFSPEKDRILPQAFTLFQNYPNPFNARTIISYDLPIPGMVSLKIYNILGEEVGSLMDSFQEAGTHRVTFDAYNLASGIYFYKLILNGSTKVAKMMLLR